MSGADKVHRIPDPKAIAESLGAARPQSDGSWQCRCPSHDDHTPSLNIKLGDGGRLLVHCHAGCSQSRVITTLKERRLWPKTVPPHGEGRATTTPSATTWQPEMPAPADAPPPNFGEASAVYAYRDEDGRPLFYITREDKPDGAKVIRPLTFGCVHNRTTGRSTTGWHRRHPSKPRPLYGLDRIAARPDARVIVVEGEKVADAAAELFPKDVVITWPGGCQSVLHADWRPLRGRSVYILPDADEPGRKAAVTAADACHAVGTASATVIAPPLGVPSGWDLADAVADGWTPARAEGLLRSLTDALAPVVPNQTAGSSVQQVVKRFS